MCLSDTAEYWNDIKEARSRRQNKRVFVHKTGLDCGHFHVVESKKIKKVDCYACIELLKATVPDYDKIMKPKPDDEYGRVLAERKRSI